MDSNAIMVLTGFLWVMLVLNTAFLAVLTWDVIKNWRKELGLKPVKGFHKLIGWDE